jgi:lysophospholipase L1-like esterase
VIRFNVLAGLLISMLISGAQAGIEPGSKELGAIWFIGDSITQSNADGDDQGSPRKALYDLLMSNGYTFTYTGYHARNVDGLPATGTPAVDNLYHYHSGVSGILIGEATGKGMRGQLAANWNTGRLARVKPNVILIMLGTNDIGHKYKEADAPDRLRSLLQEIYALPEVGTPTVFLASIPPNGRTESEAAHVIAFNAVVPGIVAEFRALGKEVHFVDQFTALNAEYATCMRNDNLHPNAQGNTIMATQWFKAISSVAETRGMTQASK